MPQKQPPATTAISCPFTADNGLSTSGFGIVTAEAPVPHASPRPNGNMMDHLEWTHSMCDGFCALGNGRWRCLTAVRGVFHDLSCEVHAGGTLAIVNAAL